MATILKNHCVLAVPDAAATAQFFVDVLGFKPAPANDGIEKDESAVHQGRPVEVREGCRIDYHGHLATV